MNPVKVGQEISICGIAYVFTEGSVMAFNAALEMKNMTGEWPENAVIPMVRKSEESQERKKPHLLQLKIVAAAVSGAQILESSL